MTRPRPKPAPALDVTADIEAGALGVQITTAMPGEAIVYYTGDLSADTINSPLIQALRAVAWDAMCLGKVDLVQRRTDRVGVFEYVAVKR